MMHSSPKSAVSEMVLCFFIFNGLEPYIGSNYVECVMLNNIKEELINMADKQSREENQCIHCGNPYREENSKPSFIRVCDECKDYRVSEGARFVRDKVLEREIDYCRPLTPKQVDTVIELYKEYERT